MSQDFNATLNLPKTDFPMRAGLPKREPEMLKAWQAERKSATLMALWFSFCSLMMALSMGMPWLSQPGM